MSNSHFVFAGGGTGGHLYPGLAVAESIRQLDPAASITFFTTERPLDCQLLAKTPHEQHPQPVQPFTLHPLRFPGFWRRWRQSVADAKAVFRSQRPRAVLGLGGYAAGPPVVAARAMGLRTAILNPDAVPGRANRYLARHADLVVLQWDESRSHFASETRCEAWGCPVRTAFRDVQCLAGRQHFGLDEDPERPVLLVTGASQGAHTVNEVMKRFWPEFVPEYPNWQLLHLTGPADEQQVRNSYDQAGVPAKVQSFTHEMPLAIAAADLVVCRAGASTLAELTALGKPGILMPYPYHRDRHQHANAQVLVDQGAAVCIEDRIDAEQNIDALRQAVEPLTDVRMRERMSSCAAAMGRSDAAEVVARWLLG